MTDRQKYPVFVEETVVHLIWVEGRDAQDAARQVTEYPYDYDRKKTDPCDGWLIGRAPSEDTGAYDWDAVYGWTGAADEQDMHVTWHRIHLDQQKRAAHAALGHPGMTDRELNGKRWCPECSWWVELDTAVAS
jgi:hypothetical protein